MALRQANRFNFLIVFVVALGSWSVGYYSSIIGSVLGMPSFYDYFNLSLKGSSGIVGAINGTYFAGGILGAVLGAWVCNLAGRRFSLLLTCFVGIAGSVLQAAAVHISMILLGRALLGICSGCFQTIVPIYQSEISPPAQRGRMVGTHGFMLVVGAAVAVWAGLGCSFASNPQTQWRVTLALCAISPLLLAPMIYWLPESPRWLISKNRNEQALRILERLHKTEEDQQNVLAREEYLQIYKQLELENKNSEKYTFMFALKHKPMRHRLFLGAFLTFLLQSTGVLVLLNYQVVLYNDLNIDGWLAICLLAVYTSWSAVGNYFNTLLVDRLGRVKMLTIGIAGGIFALIGFTIMVALFAGTSNSVGCGFGIFFVYLYTTFYAFCLDVTSYIYCAEIFPTYMRTTGMAVAIISYYAAALIYGQVAPTAFATIAWKFYIIFIIVPALGLPIVWKYFPETKGLSLEEIAGVFGDEVALEITHLSPEQEAQLREKISHVAVYTTGIASATEVENVGVELGQTK